MYVSAHQRTPAHNKGRYCATKTLTGYIVIATKKAILLDVGTEAAHTVWVPNGYLNHKL